MSGHVGGVRHREERSDEAIQNLKRPTGLLRSARNDESSPARLISLIGLTLAFAYLVLLIGALRRGDFLIDMQGRPIANDFVNVYAAGRLALDGTPGAAYDWPLHKAAEVRAVGHDFANYYGWHYPPVFLFAAAALAALPYLAALVIWLGTTLAAYATSLLAIMGGRIGALVALSFPAALWNITAGQNGFLTAALIGGTLGLLERHPVFAGLCLGLLSCKPQFGLLFPVALIAGRHWRALAAAAATAVALGALSWLVFGGSTWSAFVTAAPTTSRVILGEGGTEFERLQSAFGLVRALGGGQALAFGVQAILALALAAGVFALWRSRAPYELKAAALAAGALIATPYVFIYDFTALAVAFAFLLRFSLSRNFTIGQTVALPFAGALLLAFPYVKTQVGLAAALIVLALAVQRTLADSRHTTR